MKRFHAVNRYARIAVVGVGGGGNNTVNRMIQAGLRGVNYIAVNTEMLALLQSEAPTRIKIGSSGQGTGGDMQIAREAALDARRDLRRALQGADMVIVTAGFGGGTGTGAAPVVADVARELGALSVAIVTEPFEFEGDRRLRNAKEGFEQLKYSADTTIIIPNQNLLHIKPNVGIAEAFSPADDIIRQTVQGITDIVNRSGMVNVDFNDVRTIMTTGGVSTIGVGRASGPNRAREAARMAANSDLFGEELCGAQAILLMLVANKEMGIDEYQIASQTVQEKADPDVNFIVGFAIDESMGDEIQATLIASGYTQPVKRIQPKEVVENIEVQVRPEPVRTRRVYLSRPKSEPRRPENVPAFARNRRWQPATSNLDLPAFLRN